MPKIQLCGVKGHSPDGIGTAAVYLVTNDRMAAFGEVDANLVLASCFQADLDEGCLGIRFDDVDVRNGELACTGLSSGVNAERGILGEVRTDGEIPGSHPSVNNGNVSASGGMIFELFLQPLLRFHRFREDQQPRSLAIEPMNDEDLFRRPFPVGRFSQGRINGSRPLRLRRHRQQTCGLVYNNDALVFKHNLDPIK